MHTYTYGIGQPRFVARETDRTEDENRAKQTELLPPWWLAFIVSFRTDSVNPFRLVISFGLVPFSCLPPSPHFACDYCSNRCAERKLLYFWNWKL